MNCKIKYSDGDWCGRQMPCIIHNLFAPSYTLVLSGGWGLIVKEQDGNEVRNKLLPSWLTWMPASDNSLKP